MTTRPPKHPAPADFPLLADFFRGYLHEDFHAEHGSAGAALVTYRGDLGPRDQARLDKEAATFRAAIRGMTLARVRALLAEDFRSAWCPPSAAALRSLLKPAAR